jgi:hypothetical protein
MIRTPTLVLAILAAAMPASAAPSPYPKLESQMLQMLGKAVVKSLIDQDADATRAECVAGKALLTAKAPKYLAAYVEECFSIAAAPAGPGHEQLRCPHYLSTIGIWRASPPPMDDDDLAIARNGRLNGWMSYATKNCGAPAAPKRTDMGPIATIASGSRLQTQEGLSYLVPDGWTVGGFGATSGEAYLMHAGRSQRLHLSRVSLKHTGDYTDKSALPGGRVLEWKYYEGIPKSGVYNMSGRAKLQGAYIDFYVMRDAGAPAGSSVDKDFALETLKTIAASAKIEGTRACIGDCGPGTIIAPE